jgi:type 1 glutamine amidotransferase
MSRSAAALLVGASLGLGAFIAPAARAEGSPQHLLVFSKTSGWRHASIEPAVAALTRLAEEHGVEVDATEDATVFRPESLAGYSAVVFLLTSEEVLDDDQQSALEGYIRSGGGFAGVHSASDTEYDWPWYGRLVGAYFDGHPGDPNVRKGRLLVAEPESPATAGLPSPWVRDDEWYNLRDLEPGLSVLLDVDETSYKTAAEGAAPEPRPIAWFHEFDGGRAFYTALGHTEESYSEPLFLEHLWGGITMVMAPAPESSTGR